MHLVKFAAAGSPVDVARIWVTRCSHALFGLMFGRDLASALGHDRVLGCIGSRNRWGGGLFPLVLGLVAHSARWKHVYKFPGDKPSLEDEYATLTAVYAGQGRSDTPPRGPVEALFRHVLDDMTLDMLRLQAAKAGPVQGDQPEAAARPKDAFHHVRLHGIGPGWGRCDCCLCWCAGAALAEEEYSERRRLFASWGGLLEGIHAWRSLRKFACVDFLSLGLRTNGRPGLGYSCCHSGAGFVIRRVRVRVSLNTSLRSSNSLSYLSVRNCPQV